MLRATSEIAVAMRVASLAGKPAWVASSRPFCRAATMSASWSIPTRVSACTATSRQRGSQNREAVLEIERRVDPVEPEAELHHGGGDLGVDARDHRSEEHTSELQSPDAISYAVFS